MGYTWSLAVEEHFYIGLAILFALLMKYRPANNFDLIPTLFFSIGIYCLYMRWINITHPKVYFYLEYLFSTHLRIDSLCFGVFISYLVHFKKLTLPSKRISIVGTILLGILFILGVILFYLGSGLVVLGALKLEKSKSFILNSIGTLGTASYSIYLWHIPVNSYGVPLMNKIIGSHGYLAYISTYLLGSFLVGWIMNRVIEHPLLLLRDSLFKKQKSA